MGKTETDIMLEKALNLIKEQFKNKLDKGGTPYIKHLYTVRNTVKRAHYDVETQIIALLHDVIEDTNITDIGLIKRGFSKEIVNSLKLISRKSNESYGVYINRIANSGDNRAMHVKIADLTHNLDISRIPHPTQYDFDRMKKYKKALRVLVEGF